MQNETSEALSKGLGRLGGRLISGRSGDIPYLVDYLGVCSIPLSPILYLR